MKFSEPRQCTGDPTCRLTDLESHEPRPVWAALDAAAAHRFSGEMTLACAPTVQVWFVDGAAYYAERDGDPAIADRLIGIGVVTRDEIERGAVRVGSVSDLSRLFRRVPTLDRDRVEVGLELLTAATVGGSAEHTAATVTIANYRHHPSGVHKWQEAHRHWDDELADALRDALEDQVTYEEPAPARLRPHDRALQDWQEQLDRLTTAAAIESIVETPAEHDEDSTAELAVDELDLEVLHLEDLHLEDLLAEPTPVDEPAVEIVEPQFVVLEATAPIDEAEPFVETDAVSGWDLALVEPSLADHAVEESLEPIVIVAPEPIELVTDQIEATAPEQTEAHVEYAEYVEAASEDDPAPGAIVVEFVDIVDTPVDAHVDEVVSEVLAEAAPEADPAVELQPVDAWSPLQESTPIDVTLEAELVVEAIDAFEPTEVPEPVETLTEAVHEPASLVEYVDEAVVEDDGAVNDVDGESGGEELAAADETVNAPSTGPLWQPVIPDAPWHWAAALQSAEETPAEEEEPALVSLSLTDVIEHLDDDDAPVSDDIREAVRAALAEIQAATRPLITQGVTAADAAVPSTVPASVPASSPAPAESASAARPAAGPASPHGSLRRLIGGRGR